MEEIIRKVRSIRLCLLAHPDNEPHSEFADRIDDCDDIENYLANLNKE